MALMVAWRYLSLNQAANIVDTGTNHQLPFPRLVEQMRVQGGPGGRGRFLGPLV
jgi:hypothetical protein